MRRGIPAATRGWIEERLGGRLVRATRLRGGITATVHALTVESPSGVRSSAVLRRWADLDAAEGSARVAREAHVLRLLDRTTIPAPRLLGVSDGSATDGTAAVLMSRIPGAVDLAPKDPRAWVAQMARALTQIQQPPFELPARDPEPRREPAETPAWWNTPALWREALRVLQSPAPTTAPCFTHGDFQHFNLLWSRQRLTGVVDWVEPVVASPDSDVAHCRLNLVLLYGLERAEQLRAAYEAEAGRRTEPWWDLHRLTGYGPSWQAFIPVQVAGRIPVDVGTMTIRVEEALAAALRRL